MDKPIYRTLFGFDAQAKKPRVFTARVLPAMGVNGFKWIPPRNGLEFWHYKFEGVNVHVIGSNDVIEYLSNTGRMAIFEFNVEEKLGPKGVICHLNLLLVGPQIRSTHKIAIVTKNHGCKHRFFFTTNDMHGFGIGVSRI